MPLTAIELPGADVSIDAAWLQQSQADALLAELRRSIPWSVHRIKLFGREVDSPRLSCWIGDPDARYAYSGTHFEPHPWPQALLPIRQRLADDIGTDFDSVLANLYRDGTDYMGWHSDNEAALGSRPVIASLSLGAVRRFVFKRRDKDSGSHPNESSDDKRALELGQGSLLLMCGDTQRNYRHALPRTAKPTGARINLTFRRVLA